MRSHLYPRLALSNLRKHARLNIPYLLASACAVMMFYIMMALQRDPAIMECGYGSDVKAVLVLGVIVIGIFSLILLFYTSSLLTKQRKREFGLYNVLGMEKRHIGRLLLWETLFSALIAVAAGILCGVLFSKLMQLLLLRMMGLGANFGFGVDWAAIAATLLLFGVIFLLITANTLRLVYRSRPVELLRSANEGEREPKSKWLLALLGLVCLGAGYYLALKVNDFVGAITWFFVAVLLVIAGTYLCFTAFSIVFLKALRKNRNYYYKTSHFATVSGMIYRMKRNASGLASICILSTMVLVTVSTTVCLYLGVETMNRSMFAYDITMTGWFDNDYPRDRELLLERAETMKEVAAERGVAIEDYALYDRLSFAALRQGDKLVLEAHDDGLSPGIYNGEPDPAAMVVYLLTDDGYNQIAGADVTIEPDEALCWSGGEPFGETVTMLGRTWRTTQLEESPVQERDLYIPKCVLVLDSRETLEAIEDEEMEIYYNYGSTVVTKLQFNLSGADEERIACAAAMEDATRDSEYGYTTITNNIANRQSSYAIYGAFFFIGIFLGLLFALATVLIIYYKQISEGYDDRARYDIMQKVGMTRREIRKTVHTQVVTVFFLPLVTAAVHITFAFPMISKVLEAFSMTDTKLFAVCTLATLGIFALLYIAVYLLTARAYYRIVSTAEQ